MTDWTIAFFAKTLLLIFFLKIYIQECQSFDLISTLLSKGSGSNLPLQQLKSILSPETIQKMLEAKGLLSSVETLRGGDPTQIQKLLARLRPTTQGRVDPQILELLTSTLGRTNKTPPPHSRPQIHVSNSQNTKFSSKFRRQRPGVKNGLSRTSSRFPTTTTTTEIPENHETILQFDHVDPNIRNHKLYGWRNQNFTTIDQTEDLMMDESESPSALIPMSPSSNEYIMSSSIPTTVGHWESTGSENTEESTTGGKFTREPLQKSSGENKPIFTHFVEPTVSTDFRPSPIDHQSPPRFSEPIPEFFTTTIRNRNDNLGHSNMMGQFQRHKHQHHRRHPLMTHPMKHDRVLNVNSEINTLPIAIQSHGPLPQGIQGQESQLNYRYTKPVILSGEFLQDEPHPFEDYNKQNSMYSPSNLHHNQFHYLNPSFEQDLHGSGEVNSVASDKTDGSWSYYIILAGLVAASVVVAFVVPSFLPSAVAAGKENEDITTESNLDFWNEVKGLYSDLTHLANGNLTHFDLPQQNVVNKGKDDTLSRKKKKEGIKRGTFPIITTHDDDDKELDNTSVEPEVKSKWQRQIQKKEKVEMSTLATPVFYPVTSSSISFNRNDGTRILTEWSKVQLKVIDP